MVDTHVDIPSLTLATALARAAESINESRGFTEAMDAIVAATRTSLPEFPHVSISTRRRDGAFETAAGTDQLVWELDAIQYDLGEGPCVQAVEDEPVVVVPYLRHEQRWPAYVAAAAARGVLRRPGCSPPMRRSSSVTLSRRTSSTRRSRAAR